MPRYLEFVDALPMTENGKVQKYKLSERGVTAATWDREAAGYEVREEITNRHPEVLGALLCTEPRRAGRSSFEGRASTSERG